MPNVLEVQVISDISDLQKGLKTAEKLQAEYTASIEKTSAELKENIVISNNYKNAVNKLADEFKKGTITQKEYDKGLENLKRDEKETTIVTANLRKELANLKREQKDLGGGFDGLAKKTANGSNALIQISRIAQDAPYGFSSVINNVTASGEALGYLVRQTGSVGGAFKTLGASLIGSGGILLALSLVTSGIQFMIQNGITVGDVFDKLTGTFDETKASLAEVSAETVKNSQAEISSINAYVAIAKNRELSDEQRLIAVKKLQSEYPSYFGNLTKEQILNGNVATAVKEVTAALIAKARASALTERIVKLAEEEQKVQDKINESVAATFKFYKLSKKEAAAASEVLNKQLRGEIDLVAELEKGNANNLTKTEKIALAAFQYSATLRGLSGDLQKNTQQQDSLTKSLEDSLTAQIKLDAEQSKTGAGKKTKPANITAQVTGLDTQLKAQDLVDVNSIAVVTGELDEFGNKIKGIAEISVPAIELKPVVTSEFIASLERANETAKIVSGAIGSSVNELANQMQSSLQTGNAVLDAFVGSLIGSLAQIAQAQLTALITEKFINTAKIQTNQAVSTANAVTAATSTAAAAGPAAAVLLPGLVGGAIALMTSTFAGIQALAFAHGGVVPGGSYTGDKIPAMLNSGEAVLNNQQQANVLMSIANGNSNSLQSNRVIDNFEITSVLRGADILLSVERQKRKR